MSVPLLRLNADLAVLATSDHANAPVLRGPTRNRRLFRIGAYRHREQRPPRVRTISKFKDLDCLGPLQVPTK